MFVAITDLHLTAIHGIITAPKEILTLIPVNLVISTLTNLIPLIHTNIIILTSLNPTKNKLCDN
jgi:hypothetical protein